MPVIRLNNVVLPAPFGPMMALRSPGMIVNVTLARRRASPPKLLDKPPELEDRHRAVSLASLLTRELSIEKSAGARASPGVVG